MLNSEILRILAPRPMNPSGRQKIWDNYSASIISDEGRGLLKKFDITTRLRVAHFLAQILHESGGLTIMYESGNYSASRIMQIFGVGKHSAAVTASEAKKLAGNGPALFERVYGLGNPRKARELGNTQRGDGWRFRGTGLIQTTGRAAHETFARKIGCPIDDLCKPINSLHGALLEWQEKNCNTYADRDDIVAVTKKINGGRNGLADRRAYLAKARRLLENVSDVPAGMPKVDAPISSTSPADRIETPSIGDEGGSVNELQELLVRAGYVVPVDGKMGPRTEAAVAGFQVNHGLTGTGVADDATWQSLREVKAPPPREVSEDTLAKTSRIVSKAQTLKSVVTWAWRTILLGIAWVAQQLGFNSLPEDASTIDVAEHAANTADRVGSLAGRFDLTRLFDNPMVLVLIALVLFGFACLYFRKQLAAIISARVDDAQSGANLSS